MFNFISILISLERFPWVFKLKLMAWQWLITWLENSGYQPASSLCHLKKSRPVFLFLCDLAFLHFFFFSFCVCVCEYVCVLTHSCVFLWVFKVENKKREKMLERYRLRVGLADWKQRITRMSVVPTFQR